jgi:hypothetical protein
MPVMIRKLLEDFANANAIDNSIITKQLDIETGVEILRDMIKKVRDDIKTLDETVIWKNLESKIKELDNTNIIRKKKLQENVTPNDSIDKRHLELSLLREDHQRYKQELVIIQNLCYRKGWFD